MQRFLIKTELFLWSFFMVFGAGCADEADFGGSGGTKKAVDEAEPEIVVAAPPSSCDLSGDFVNLKFPSEIQSCVDQGNLYNFGTGSCSDIPKASSYNCDFDSLGEATMRIDINVPAFADAKSNGAKLIGCGERRDGKTIVAQWLVNRIDEETCTFDDNMKVVTGCFQQDNGDGTKVDGTPEEIVAACLSGD